MILYLNFACGYLNIACGYLNIVSWDDVFERGGVVIGYLELTCYE